MRRLAGVGLVGSILVTSGLGLELAPRVTLHTDRLPIEEKAWVKDLDSLLQRLIRETNWTRESDRLLLPVHIDIYFDKYGRDGFLHRYAAGVLVAFPGGTQFRDRRWEFYYDPNQRLTLGDPYHPLTGLVEFYLQLGLGVEMDRRGLLGGESFYQRAQTIGENARFEALYTLGWEERRELVRAIRDTSFIPVRQAAYFGEEGLRLLTQDQEAKARECLTQACRLLLQSTPEKLNLNYGDHTIRWMEIDRLLKSLEDTGLEDLAKTIEEWHIMLNQSTQD